MNIKQLLAEIQSVPPYSEIPKTLAIAILSDLFRKAGATPPQDSEWRSLWHPLHAILAHWISATSLGENTIGMLRKTQKPATGFRSLNQALDALEPGLLLHNSFRQEETLRHWAAAWGLGITGETAKESQKRLETLDYRKTLQEFSRAEEARKKEERARLAALEAARAAEEAARGWRE